MILGIEIGGTKLQLGVGKGHSAQIDELVRTEVNQLNGAQGILTQVEEILRSLIKKYPIERIGIGFGGPVRSDLGKVLTSHQVEGWSNFLLADWCMEKFGIEALVANDCELAALAESLYGVSMNANPSIYVTVGTGVGCGVIIDGSVYRGRGHGAAEIGHLRPIVSRDRVPKPMEVKCSGPGIAAEVRRVLEGHLANGHNHVPEDDVEELLSRCNGDLDSLSCKLVAASAINGNEIALEAYRNGTDMIGWGIAQVATLFAPEVVAVGGGVSLAGEEVFFKPLSQAIERYLTPTFHGAFDVLPSALGEEIVVHGALALASVQTDQLVA